MSSHNVEKTATTASRDAHHTVTEKAVEDTSVLRQGTPRNLTASHPVESVGFGYGGRRTFNALNPIYQVMDQRPTREKCRPYAVLLPPMRPLWEYSPRPRNPPNSKTKET